VTAALSALGLGRRYGKTWALRDCTMETPRGSVTALVGPNGAGKTTLLQLAIGMIDATEGEIRILGESMRGQPLSMLARVGFVAQETPLYRSFSVADMLRFGCHLNPRWDDGLARARLELASIPLDRACGQLSGGQQAQVALALAVAKRPDVLLLDEPVARLDPLARRAFLESLMEIVAEHGVSVVLSSHLVSDLERICDYLVVLSDGHVTLEGSVERLLAEHHAVNGPRREIADIRRDHSVITARTTERQMMLLVRGHGAILDPHLDVSSVDLEELVLAYLGRGSNAHVLRTPVGAPE
jgi:ABC-2 type transport system ATP-binding protein